MPPGLEWEIGLRLDVWVRARVIVGIRVIRFT